MTRFLSNSYLSEVVWICAPSPPPPLLQSGFRILEFLLDIEKKTNQDIKFCYSLLILIKRGAGKGEVIENTLFNEVLGLFVNSFRHFRLITISADN